MERRKNNVSTPVLSESQGVRERKKTQFVEGYVANFTLARKEAGFQPLDKGAQSQLHQNAANVFDALWLNGDRQEIKRIIKLGKSSTKKLAKLDATSS